MASGDRSKYFDHVHAPMLVANADAVVIAANLSATQFFKKDLKQMIKQPLESLLSEAQIDDEGGFRSKQELIDAFFSEQSVFSKERFFANAESNLLVEFEAVGLVEDQREPVILFSKVVEDSQEVVITVKPFKDSKFVRMLLETQEKLESNARLAKLGDMVSGVAHEINNPLAIIHGHGEVLSFLATQSELETEVLVKTIDVIQDSAMRISRIIKSLQSLSRDDSGDPFLKVTAGEITRVAFELSKKKILDHGIQFLFDEPADDYKVECHPSQMAQALVNMMSNAIDAIADTRKPWVKLEVVKNADDVTFRVIDSGPGIPHDLQEQIMQPFFSTKKKKGASGYGLSQCVGVAARHGGVFELDISNKNTCFQITIPLEQKSRRPKLEDNEDLDTQDKPFGADVLVIDDEAELRSLVQRFLKTRKISVETSSSGNQALRMIAEKEYTMIISDVKMADGDGFHVLESIKTMENPPPILFVTGSTNFQQEEFLKLGAVDLLYKPVNMPSLMDLVEGQLKKIKPGK